MTKLDKMFGGTTKEQKWKKENSDHISNYNKSYYSNPQNKKKIVARRKVQRKEKRKSQNNDFLGF